MRADIGKGRGWKLDLLAVAPGFLAAVAVDVWPGLAFGLVSAVSMVLVRRRLWPDRPVGGRLAAALLTPLLALTLASLIIDPGESPLFAVLLALPLLGLIEAVARRGGRSLVRGFPLLTVATLLVLSGALAALFLLPRTIRFDVTDLPRQTCRPAAPARWSDEAAMQAFTLVRSIAADAPAGETAALERETAPNGIAVSLYRGDGARKQGLVSDRVDAREGLREATERAMASTPWRPGRKRDLEVDSSGDWSKARIRIDLLGEPRTVPRRPLLHLFSSAQRTIERFNMLGDLHHLTYEVEPGLDGLAVSSDGRSTTVLPADPRSEGWLTPKVGSRPGKLRRILRRAWSRDHGRPLDTTDADRVGVKRFRATSLLQLDPGARPRLAGRSNAVPPGTLGRDRLEAALRSAAGWLARQMGPDGKFHYEIQPPHTAATEDYGIARHAGATYALLAFYRRTEGVPGMEQARADALGAAVSGIVFAGKTSRAPDADRHPDDLCFAKEDGAAPSGATALAAIAIALLPRAEDVKDPELRRGIEALPLDRWLAGMGSCLLHMVDEKGAVFGDYQTAMRQSLVEEERRFFPGEVMLSLAHLHRRTGDERYAEAAGRIGQRQLDLNSKSLALDLPVEGDHWFAQSLVELSETTGDARYAELSLLIARYYLLEQYPPGGGPEPDYRGAYLTVDLPSSNHAACRGEALGAALRGARLLGEGTAAIERGILEGARFLLSQQMTRELSYFVPDGIDVLGAFRMDPVDNHLRIDNNQHGIVALLAALEVLGES